MASLPIYYRHNQPLLMTDDDNNTSNLAPSAGARGRPIARSRSALARRADSSSLNKNGATNNGGGGSVRLRPRGDPEDSSIDRIKRCQTAPGYVSFDDIIGGDEAFARWREADGVIISHPLVRTASRLYALTDATDRQPRHSRPSPGPFGTRRGSALHWIAKRYLGPCLGFLASALFCRSPASATCSV